MRYVLMQLSIFGVLFMAGAAAGQPGAQPAADWSAQRWLEYAETAAEQIEDPADRVSPLASIALGYAMLDDPAGRDRVTELVGRADELLPQVADEEERGYLSGDLAYALARLGRVEAARERISTMPTLAARISARLLLASAAYDRGDAAGMRAALDEVRQDLPRLDDWERDYAASEMVPYLLVLGEGEEAEARLAEVEDPAVGLSAWSWGVYLLSESGRDEEAKAWARRARDAMAAFDAEERGWVASIGIDALAEAGLPGEAEELLPLVEIPGERISADLSLARAYGRAGEDGLAAGLLERAVEATAAFEPGEDDWYTAADLWAEVGLTANQIGRLGDVVGRLDTLDPDAQSGFASAVAQNKLYLDWRAERLANPMRIDGGGGMGREMKEFGEEIEDVLE